MRRLTFPLFVSLPLLACGGPSVADIVSQEVVLSLSAVASQPEVAAVGDTQGGAAVERLYLSASALSLLPCRENTEPLVLAARGYELLEKPSPREQVDTAVTELCGIRLEVEPVTDDLLDGVPEGASLYVEGTDAEGTAFAISSEMSSQLMLEAEADESFGAVPLLLGVDVSVLLADVPLDEASAAQAGEQLAARLGDAVSLYSDENGNRQLDDEDREPLASAAAP